MMRTLVAVAALSLLIAGCSSGGRDAPPSSSAEAPAAIATTTTAPKVETFKIGEVATNGGVKLTVTSATNPPTIPMMTNSMRKNSGYDVYGDVAPRAGGKFVRVDATVENVGQVSVDLTCSWPIEVFAADATNRMFDPVDELYKLQGTPECNENLQPGFSSPMTYVFEVPESADVRIFGFADTKRDSEDPTFVVITPQTPGPLAPTVETDATPEVTAEPTYEAPIEAPVVSEEPPIGYTAAPTGEPTPLPGKEIDYCMNGPTYQTGTTMFTDGTTGWTQECAG
ncbi:hypothetical protein [Williamsia muralis]|jgi:hypothetical protein|uniref:DUF4352 domain-containing protein n=1 Tax=Williamsia marianensis TaxID=85044 RepID=A0ABU4EY75_WILMA|nr:MULTISPECIES: hypothetical protein [Williamsia]MDV7136192.1 hypothetical protein [Williamsia muralis]